jgi:hypothetical protein
MPSVVLERDPSRLTLILPVAVVLWIASHNVGSYRRVNEANNQPILSRAEHQDSVRLPRPPTHRTHRRGTGPRTSAAFGPTTLLSNASAVKNREAKTALPSPRDSCTLPTSGNEPNSNCKWIFWPVLTKRCLTPPLFLTYKGLRVSSGQEVRPKVPSWGLDHQDERSG